MHLRFRCLAATAVLAALGCGGGQTRGHPFDRVWNDESGTELAAFVANWTMPQAAPSSPLAVGSVAEVALVGAAYGSVPWRVEFPVEGSPVLAGHVAVALGGGRLIAVDAASGAELWRLPALGHLRGASDDGVTTLVSIGSLSGKRSQVLAVAPNGTVMRQLVDDELIGPSVVLDDFAFLPLGGRAILVFDLVSGREAARVPARLPLTRAFVAEDALYFGDEEVLRFDGEVVAARHGGGTRVRVPERFFPGNPRWRSAPDGLERPRAELLAMPRGNTLIALAYHAGPFLLGLDPLTGRSRWLYRHARTMLGGRAAAEGFVLCDSGGGVVVVDKHGNEQKTWSLGTPVDRCDASVGNVTDTSNVPDKPLSRSLAEALEVPDPAWLDVQLFLVDEVARGGARQLHELAARLTSGDCPTEPADVARARSALVAHAQNRIQLGRTSSPVAAPVGVQ